MDYSNISLPISPAWRTVSVFGVLSIVETLVQTCPHSLPCLAVWRVPPFHLSKDTLHTADRCISMPIILPCYIFIRNPPMFTYCCQTRRLQNSAPMRFSTSHHASQKPLPVKTKLLPRRSLNREYSLEGEEIQGINMVCESRKKHLIDQYLLLICCYGNKRWCPSVFIHVLSQHCMQIMT